ncbi:endonuclease/exonuclease/phosphatase family protein [Chitinophaga costaii]|nr:endonuclease/exonuclease/phosphatase family protein [Chitinophaga costaii]
MSGKFKAALLRLLLVLHLLTSLLLLLSVLLPLLHPRAFWPSGLAGLFFVPLLALSLCFIPVWWWWYKRPYYWLSIILLLPCIPAMEVSFGLHPFRQQPLEKKDNGFTIMSFNTSSMGLKHYMEDSAEQQSIYDMLQTASPDILCLQEFYTSPNKDRTDHLSLIQERLGYSDHFFTNDGNFFYTCYVGIVLYSRFPILHATRILLDTTNLGSGNSVLQADLRIDNDTVRVFALQLKSYMFRDAEYQDIRRIKTLRDITLSASRHVLAKMYPTFARRAQEADTLHTLIAQSPYPVLLCGDFNDVPVSYTYRTISRDMNDAFLSQGWGLGRTFHALSPTLRIDYILSQPAFQIDGYASFARKGFEHVPIMAALSLRR